MSDGDGIMLVLAYEDHGDRDKKVKKKKIV